MTVEPQTEQAIHLHNWRHTIDQLLHRDRVEEAQRLILVMLLHIPRYLPMYVQMLQTLWLRQRWAEGRSWAQRLLRADPTHELAWSMLANANEMQEEPVVAHRYWQLAFEQAPYSRPIRVGFTRTSLGRHASPSLNLSALGTAYRLGGRWDRAVDVYTELTDREPARLDLQCSLLESLWRAERVEESVNMARRLVKREPNLLLAWLVSGQAGDENDRALARAPLSEMDPDGAYAVVRYGYTAPPQRAVPVAVSDSERNLLEKMQRMVADSD